VYRRLSIFVKTQFVLVSGSSRGRSPPGGRPNLSATSLLRASPLPSPPASSGGAEIGRSRSSRQSPRSFGHAPFPHRPSARPARLLSSVRIVQHYCTCLAIGSSLRIDLGHMGLFGIIFVSSWKAAGPTNRAKQLAN